MQILYDASLLGMSYRNGSLSGLMRSAENLLFALAERRELEITLTASLSFQVSRFSQQYHNARQHISQTSFHRKNISRQPLYKLLSGSDDTRTEITSLNASLYQRLLKKLFEINYRPLRHSDIRNTDIYHSPYHSFPRLVQNSQNLKRVLTVHDIIPIIHPEYFGLPKAFRGKHFDKEYNLLKTLENLDKETWIHCPSMATRDDLCNHFGNQIDPEKISIIPWGASSRFYPCKDAQKLKAFQQKYQLPEGDYILSLSTLEPRKNIIQVIRSFAKMQMQENLPDLYLILAGEKGWQYQPIFQELNRLKNLRDRIIFTGYVADDDLATLYSNARVFVYPSFYEGFGLPPLEAMQCGTPVITSNVSSLPEVIGDAGILLSPTDTDAIAESMLKICTDETFHQRLTKKSRLRAAHFGWDKTASHTVNAYQQAVS